MAIKFPADIQYNAKKPLEKRYDYKSVGALLDGGYNYPDGALFNAVENSSYGGKSYPAGLYEFKGNAWSLIETGGRLSEEDRQTLIKTRMGGLFYEKVWLHNILERPYLDDNGDPISLTPDVFGIDGYSGLSALDAARQDGVIDENGNLVNIPEGLSMASEESIESYMHHLWRLNEEGKVVYDGEYIYDNSLDIRIWVGEHRTIRFPSRRVVATSLGRGGLYLSGGQIDVRDDGSLTVTYNMANQTPTSSSDSVWILTKNTPTISPAVDVVLYNDNVLLRYLSPDDGSNADGYTRPLIQEVAKIDDASLDTDIPSVGAIRKFVGEGSGGGGSISGSVCTEAQIDSLTF